jgi:ATP-grasp domain, R2K clade family 2
MVDDFGVPVDSNMYALLDGFRDLGEEVRLYRRAEYLADIIPASPDHIAVGYVEVARRQFHRMSVPQPADLDYPPALSAFLGRVVVKSTVSDVRRGDIFEKGPVFVKPVRHKQFTGFVCRSERDLLRINAAEDSDQVWLSEVVDLRSEHRCYIHIHAIVDVRRYAGDFRAIPDFGVLDCMLKTTSNDPQPMSCCLDVGVTVDGRTILIEANDGFAMGNYGLSARRYAELLRDRWNQIVTSSE